MKDVSNPNKREKQRLERRQQILECSLDMMISRGYEAMKIRDIADRLQISSGLFFNYFESKEKIYEELIKIGISGPENVLKINTGEIEPIVIFKKMTEAIFESLRTYSITAKMFLLMSQTIRSETAPESVKKLVANFDAVTPIIPVIR
ncbi:MAG: TetR/AcrR family transcriptional regulator, partial [Clostridia bacterium]|nr:TetR/AcrR family transcriptional regulator [Clostridia bacterium]